MKLPTLNVRTLPSFYKHCCSVFAIHIDLKDIELSQTYDKAFVDAYLSYSSEQLYQAITGNFILNMGSKVVSHNETFVICKDGLDKKQLEGFVNAIFAELNMYTDAKVDCSYRVIKCMLFLENQPVKLWKSSFMGEELLNSSEYNKNIHAFKKNSKPRGKYLLTLEEFSKHYHANKQVITKKEPPKKIEPVITKDIVENEEAYTYYI
ncbi:MAG: hypothetical protein RR986_08495 [Longicatena sp.]